MDEALSREPRPPPTVRLTRHSGKHTKKSATTPPRTARKTSSCRAFVSSAGATDPTSSLPKTLLRVRRQCDALTRKAPRGVGNRRG